VGTFQVVNMRYYAKFRGDQSKLLRYGDYSIF